MPDKKIFLLIGQKGSGKSFIGTLMEKEFQIHFLRVEKWAKDVKRDRAIDNIEYLNEVFTVIEQGVRNELNSCDEIVFESTGITNQFDRMLGNLRHDFRVVTIGVHAESNLCLERVQTRDQSIHINVSDKEVQSINKQVLLKAQQTDYGIHNDNATYESLVKNVSDIVQKERGKILH
jgi:shikimate kinase